MTETNSTHKPTLRSVWPIEIRVTRAEKRMEVDFDDDVTFSYAAPYLRVASPSASKRGHGQSHDSHSPPIVLDYQDVGIVTIEPIGNYAIRIVFDDGHTTGLYSWEYLYRLGVEQEQRCEAYLAKQKVHPK